MRTESTTDRNSNVGVNNTVPWDLVNIKPLSNYKVEVEFVDGVKGIVDYSLLINGDNAGVFEALKNVEIFNQVHIVDGVATWPGNIDVCPDTMHDEVENKKVWVV